jgi:hypothetical protein
MSGQHDAGPRVALGFPWHARDLSLAPYPCLVSFDLWIEFLYHCRLHAAAKSSSVKGYSPEISFTSRDVAGFFGS